LQVGSIVQQHAGAVDSLVSELLPIAVEYLEAEAADVSDSTAAPATQQPQPQEQQQEYQRQNAKQQQQQCQQVQEDATSSIVGSSSSSKSSMPLTGFDQASVSQQLVDYSLAIAAAVPSADMARREFAWRNGWFLGRRVTPRHEQWLQRADCQDLLMQYAKQ
jgi:hypothetical protein